jgi:hypothetical protein
MYWNTYKIKAFFAREKIYYTYYSPLDLFPHPMYTDVINYKLAAWVTLEHLYKINKKVYDERMSSLEGFIKREIHTDEEGEYFDLVTRTSKEAAEKAYEAWAPSNPYENERVACYDMTSINSKGLTCIKAFDTTDTTE